ncbi:MAG: 3-dehydroquinate synthase [Prevotellaceae bacterium]|jgi:3-dehydroquinate synthase|nr:3-dehydroquinate synthase [Prevotellaceae bacterium]
MNIIKLDLPFNRVSTVAIGESTINLYKYIGNRRCVIVIDWNVVGYYCTLLPESALIIPINVSEEKKNLSMIDHILSLFIKFNVDRSWMVIGIGGGITCDIVGFAASIYMRGMSFGFVASSLLAQADASVGGKNGVNHDKYKNMLGVFNHPEFVICDMIMLQTLPLQELRTGVAEIVKASIISDRDLFQYIKQNVEQIEKIDRNVIIEILTRSVQIKANIVQADERESGERRKLNLGHTFGHAIERYGELNHGQAVSVGISISADISQKLGLLSSEENMEIKKLLTSFSLPIHTKVKKKYLMEAVTHDKKCDQEKIHYVLIKSIGEVEIRSFEFSELKALLRSIDSCV